MVFVQCIYQQNNEFVKFLCRLTDVAVMFQCSFFSCKLYQISAVPIINMPMVDMASADSPGRNDQLKIAPKTGMMNFQRFKSETFTPGRWSKTNQMVKATAEIKLNHPNAK